MVLLSMLWKLWAHAEQSAVQGPGAFFSSTWKGTCSFTAEILFYLYCLDLIERLLQ